MTMTKEVTMKMYAQAEMKISELEIKVDEIMTEIKHKTSELAQEMANGNYDYSSDLTLLDSRLNNVLYSLRGQYGILKSIEDFLDSEEN